MLKTVWGAEREERITTRSIMRAPGNMWSDWMCMCSRRMCVLSSRGKPLSDAGESLRGFRTDGEAPKVSAPTTGEAGGEGSAKTASGRCL